jgi:hypothetical protein
MDGIAANYLCDLGALLVEQAQEAKFEAARTQQPYDLGRSFGLYQAVSLMVQQADAFGFGHSEIGLEGVDPDRDLL